MGDKKPAKKAAPKKAVTPTASTIDTTSKPMGRSARKRNNSGLARIRKTGGRSKLRNRKELRNVSPGKRVEIVARTSASRLVHVPREKVCPDHTHTFHFARQRGNHVRYQCGGCLTFTPWEDAPTSDEMYDALTAAGGEGSDPAPEVRFSDIDDNSATKLKLMPEVQKMVNELSLTPQQLAAREALRGKSKSRLSLALAPVLRRQAEEAGIEIPPGARKEDVVRLIMEAVNG